MDKHVGMEQPFARIVGAKGDHAFLAPLREERVAQRAECGVGQDLAEMGAARRIAWRKTVAITSVTRIIPPRLAAIKGVSVSPTVSLISNAEASLNHAPGTMGIPYVKTAQAVPVFFATVPPNRVSAANTATTEEKT